MTTDQGPAPAKPQRCILYGRISDDRPDEDNGGKKKGEGVKDQEADLRRYARRLGWKVGRVIIENDTSAFKRKTVTLPNGERAMRVDRKGWRSLLDDLAAGKADGLLAVTSTGSLGTPGTWKTSSTWSRRSTSRSRASVARSNWPPTPTSPWPE